METKNKTIKADMIIGCIIIALAILFSSTVIKPSFLTNSEIRTVLYGEVHNTTVVVDPLTNSLNTIDVSHAEIHAGNTYRDYAIADVVDDGNLDILIKTQDKQTHLTLYVSTEGDAEGYLYEDVTATVNGTLLNSYNAQRADFSSRIAQTLTFQNPTITDLGLLLDYNIFFGGDKSKVFGAEAETREEWVLDENSYYLIRITNRAGTTAQIFIKLEWYEVNPFVFG